MKPFYDWTASTITERTLNAALRLFGWDCCIERHGLQAWQWGLDRPEAALTAQIGNGKVVALPGYSPHLSYDLWIGPFQLTLSRI